MTTWRRREKNQFLMREKREESGREKRSGEAKKKRLIVKPPVVRSWCNEGSRARGLNAGDALKAPVPSWLSQRGPSLLWTNGDDIYGINQAWQLWIK